VWFQLFNKCYSAYIQHVYIKITKMCKSLECVIIRDKSVLIEWFDNHIVANCLQCAGGRIFKIGQYIYIYIWQRHGHKFGVTFLWFTVYMPLCPDSWTRGIFNKLILLLFFLCHTKVWKGISECYIHSSDLIYLFHAGRLLVMYICFFLVMHWYTHYPTTVQ